MFVHHTIEHKRTSFQSHINSYPIPTNPHRDSPKRKNRANSYKFAHFSDPGPFRFTNIQLPSPPRLVFPVRWTSRGGGHLSFQIYAQVNRTMSPDPRTIQDPALEDEEQKIKVRIQSTMPLNQEMAAKVQSVLEEATARISALVNVV